MSSTFEEDNEQGTINFGVYPVVTNARVNTRSLEDPLSDDGTESGYHEGSVWINTVTNKAFICVDATTGAAVWKETTATGSGSFAMDDLSDVEIVTPADGEALVYNSTSGKWENVPNTSTDHGALTGLADDDHTQYHNNTRGDARYSLLAHVHTGVYEPANANIQSHITNTSNPHSVTKAQVGLTNVDNTSDANKPVSTATQTALDGKSSTSHNHTGTYEPANANIQSHITNTSNPHSVTSVQILPAQTGHTGEFLTTNGTAVSWATVPSGGGAVAIDDLTDVIITTPANGQALQYNGTNWVNTTPSTGVTDHGLLTGLSDDDHNQYHNDTRGDARYYTQTQINTNYYTITQTDNVLSGYDKAPTVGVFSTTDATPYVYGSISTTTGETQVLTITVRGTDASTHDVMWKRVTLCYKNVAGTVTFVGGMDSTIGYDTGAATWAIDVAPAVSPTYIAVTITGEAAKTINWVVTVKRNDAYV